MFQNFNIVFDYLLMLTIFHVQIDHFNWCLCDFLVLINWLFTDVDYFSIVFLIIYWCWLFFMCKMFLSFLSDVYCVLKHIKCTHFLEFAKCFWLFTDVCSFHSRLILWFSCTETHRWSVCTSSSFVIYWC